MHIGMQLLCFHVVVEWDCFGLVEPAEGLRKACQVSMLHRYVLLPLWHVHQAKLWRMTLKSDINTTGGQHTVIE